MCLKFSIIKYEGVGRGKRQGEKKRRHQGYVGGTEEYLATLQHNPLSSPFGLQKGILFIKNSGSRLVHVMGRPMFPTGN